MSIQKSKIPSRDEIPAADKWDLNKLFKNKEEWEKSFQEYNSRIPHIEQFRGSLSISASKLKECLDFMSDFQILDERLGYYAHLRVTEDAGSSTSQERFARYIQAATKAQAMASYQAPEIQAIEDQKIQDFLKTEELKDYLIYLNKLLRYKPHILSEKEERLLAMQEESNMTAQKSFTALTDVDMEFGTINTDEGEVALSQSSFASLMLNQNRDVRKSAFHQFMENFDKHKNTISSLFSGSISLDIYRSKVRNFESSRAAKLFPDDVPGSVYDNLVDAVHRNLGTLYRYYEIRKKALELDELHLYDTKVPLVGDIKVQHTYTEALEVVLKALNPLGEEYCSALRKGLSGGWVDRYENKGKKSGAFSAGSYIGDPYILMNYQEDVLRDVFTLAHEAGHSMHSWYSVRNNPFQNYQYTIFEAEVASTFNEQLLLKYLYDNTESDQMKTYLTNKQIDDIIGTLFRQTMFAEYEDITHKMMEGGTPLTVESLRHEYKQLLIKYFGDGVVIDDDCDLEGLRIPHFYRSFYVYKYATGISAAITLSEGVLTRNVEELDAYFNFLKSGGSRFPLESLKAAGVDMTKPEPVEKAIAVFSNAVDRLESLL
jgi:oligoendopeptidase F